MVVVHTCSKCGNQDSVQVSPKVSTPKEGTKTGLVWDLCQSMSTELGHRVPRKDLLKKGLELGYNVSTIQTQYQRWYKTQYPNGDTKTE